MNAEDTIYFACAAHTIICPNKASALNYLIAVGGNGYKWKNGELIQTYDYDHSKSLKENIRRVHKETNIRHVHERASLLTRSKEPGWTIIYEQFPELLQEQLDIYADVSTPEDIDFRVGDMSTYDIEEYGFYPFTKAAPDGSSITESWLKAVLDFYQLVIDNQSLLDRLYNQKETSLKIARDYIDKWGHLVVDYENN